jgi:porin
MKKWIIIVGLFMTGIVVAKAQLSFEAEYTTEMQTNFGKEYNWVNLLWLSAELPSEKISKRWKNGSFQVQFISTYKLFDKRLADDLLHYSNIEEENVLINPWLVGYTHQWDKVSLFGGVRSINNDYFATPYTSLFTNSSAGIFPTLDQNFPLANYPLSAVCLHFEYQPIGDWLFKTSLYNGVAHDPRKNPLRSFTVNPLRDGIFSISELSYKQNKLGSGIYSLGIGVQAFGEFPKPMCSLWGTVEQAVHKNDRREIGFIVHGGFVPSTGSVCRFYYAFGGYFAGLISKQKKDKLGIYVNEAIFSDIKEQTLEITWQYQIIDAIAVQPAVHFIRTGEKNACVGLFRVIFSAGS